jgi:hypothetical protein
LIGDVVLYRGSEPAVVIELFATSRVTQDKAGRLLLPWVELDAQEVVDRPYWWVAVQDGLRTFSCPECARREAARAHDVEQIQKRARQTAVTQGLEFPAHPEYHAVSQVCWRCSAEIVVYVWRSGGRHSTRRPPEPIPRTVRHQVTEGAGAYWANCCPKCAAVQGDYYLVKENTAYRLVREWLHDPFHVECG